MPHLRWWTIRLLTRPSQLLIATFVRDLSFNLPTKWQFSIACLFSTFPSFPITSTLKLGVKSLLFRFKWRWKSFPKADTLYCISSSCALPTARRMRILGKESSCDTKVPSSSTWIGCTMLYSGTETKMLELTIVIFDLIRSLHIGCYSATTINWPLGENLLTVEHIFQPWNCTEARSRA